MLLDIIKHQGTSEVSINSPFSVWSYTVQHACEVIDSDSHPYLQSLSHQGTEDHIEY